MRSASSRGSRAGASRWRTPRRRNDRPMIDAYLWFTPLFVLGVLALVRFIGCDLVFLPGSGPVSLDAPANFTARPGNHQIDLAWEAVDGADGYRISRAEAPGPPYPTIFNVAGSQTTFTDSPLTNGVTEFYVKIGRAHV